MHPLRTGPVAAILLAVLALLAPAAQAAPEREPEHHATFDVTRIDTTHYRFFGRVTTYPGGKILVLRQHGSGTYRQYSRVALDDAGRFSTRLSGARGDCFRMRIPKADGHRTTTADLGCLVSR